MNDEGIRSVGTVLAFALGSFALGAVLGAAGRDALDEGDEAVAAAARSRTLREATDSAYRQGYRDGFDVARREAVTRENRIAEQAHWDGATVGFRNGREYERREGSRRAESRTVVRGSGG